MECIKLVSHLSMLWFIQLILEAFFASCMTSVLLEHGLALVHDCVILHVLNETATKLFAFINKADQVLVFLLALLVRP